jgi:hypothetical protein
MTKTKRQTEATECATQEVPVKPVDFEKIKEGDLMAFLYYAKVTRKESEYHNRLEGSDYHNRLGRVHVTGLAGAPSVFHVQGYDLIEAGFSADQYSKTEVLSRTKVAEILTTSYNRPFTVCFDKADGRERILRGRLVQPEPLLGRSHVEDLDIMEGSRLRLVDHRTLKWLIVNGVRYNVK